MKKWMSVLVTGLVTVSLLAQEYYSRGPRPEELRRVAGLNFYPADGPSANWLLYAPTNYQLFDLNGALTNHVVFGSLAATNVYVRFPNCTQNVGRIFRVIAGDRVTAILTNENAQTFSDITNAIAGPFSIWTMRTNTSVTVFSTGTNWFVIPGKL